MALRFEFPSDDLERVRRKLYRLIEETKADVNA